MLWSCWPWKLNSQHMISEESCWLSLKTCRRGLTRHVIVTSPHESFQTQTLRFVSRQFKMKHLQQPKCAGVLCQPQPVLSNARKKNGTRNPSVLGRVLSTPNLQFVHFLDYFWCLIFLYLSRCVRLCFDTNLYISLRSLLKLSTVLLKAVTHHLSSASAKATWHR